MPTYILKKLLKNLSEAWMLSSVDASRMADWTKFYCPAQQPQISVQIVQSLITIIYIVFIVLPFVNLICCVVFGFVAKICTKSQQPKRSNGQINFSSMITSIIHFIAYIFRIKCNLTVREGLEGIKRRIWIACHGWILHPDEPRYLVVKKTVKNI